MTSAARTGRRCASGPPSCSPGAFPPTPSPSTRRPGRRSSCPRREPGGSSCWRRASTSSRVPAPSRPTSSGDSRSCTPGRCRWPAPSCSASRETRRRSTSRPCRSAASRWPRRRRSTPSATRSTPTRRLLWFIGPVLVALVAGLAWLLAGRALRPVHAVTSRVAEIGSHSLHERVPVPASDDEIAELARTMNGMLGRLETATTTSRRLVSDASHELRTPVAVMRAELEVARMARATGLAAVERGAPRRARPPAGSRRRPPAARTRRRAGVRERLVLAGRCRARGCRPDASGAGGRRGRR